MKYRFLTMAFAICFVNAVALASDTWTLDPSASYVRLLQGSKANPALVNTGVARVTGRIELDANDLDHSTLDLSIYDLSIYPADENWGHVLSPEGIVLTGYIPGAFDQTLLTFRPKHTMKTDADKVEVIGDLSLSRVERTITAIPSEGYAGPVYGDPVVHTDTRKVAFFFPSVSATSSSVPLTPTALQSGVLELVGSARIDREDFPNLAAAIGDTNWPPVVRNEVCFTPSTAGEDYAGTLCTRTVLTATHDDSCHPAGVGEDYGGLLCIPKTGDQTTIVLDLKFLHATTAPSARMLIGPAAPLGNR
jgi:polyisoprenoid-binding protein YceI